ncbi:MAG: hypothetical protein JO064_10005 [Actinobacteria bacterium]|nr:hypothetical protein [Actinomycetota bacterium]
MPEHLIGLLLGTEDDWPRAFEALVAKLPAIEYRGERHVFRTERVVNEPFDLRAKPRYELVIDRLGWWYDLAREWVKKCALMDDVYLLNNPFTFQAMEKHSAYCAMMRLGLKVPPTWMVPHKRPAPMFRREYMAPKLEHMAARYNLPFDLEDVAEAVGYPLYMKPFDGGQWVGVTRIGNPAELHAQYDASGERLMHLQASVEGYDVFARSLSIGAETTVMCFDPDAPMHERYRVEHEFLSAETGFEVVTISRLVNAFFRWEFNSCEVLVRDGEVHPIDYANASPDVALTSLHYYFPWAMEALVKWCVFCIVTGRRMAIDQDQRRYFELGDSDASYEEKLSGYRGWVDEYFQVDEYAEFCAAALPQMRELTVGYVASPAFDALLVDTVREVFPAHEHDAMIERHRGLVGAWAREHGSV